MEIAKECNITFQKGDILFIRIGVTKEWDTVMTPAQKQAYADNPKPEHAGVEATIDVLRWLWNTGFAAIASDAISWEVSSSCPISRAEHQQGSAGPLTWSYRSIRLRTRICSCMSMSLRDGVCRLVSGTVEFAAA